MELPVTHVKPRGCDYFSWMHSSLSGRYFVYIGAFDEIRDVLKIEPRIQSIIPTQPCRKHLHKYIGRKDFVEVNYIQKGP